MKVTLSDWQESATCSWCEKSRECVTATFSDGFVKDASFCFRCLQTAVRVRSRQQNDKAPAPETR